MCDGKYLYLLSQRPLASVAVRGWPEERKIPLLLVRGVIHI